jgi:hypothetical protein
MNRPELSALLEVFSFFFVKTHLYGKSGLEKTNIHLVSLLEKPMRLSLPLII